VIWKTNLNEHINAPLLLVDQRGRVTSWQAMEESVLRRGLAPKSPAIKRVSAGILFFFQIIKRHFEQTKLQNMEQPSVSRLSQRAIRWALFFHLCDNFYFNPKMQKIPTCKTACS
jgi:hypothetical protein